MKKIFRLLGLTAIVTAVLVFSLASAASASVPLGPNPLAGDGISDGSSLDAPNGPGTAEKPGLSQN